MTTLEVAIPLWRERVSLLTPDERSARGAELASYIGEHGDDILYRGKYTAEAFNALAEGLALASSVPGGVNFGGQHWHDGWTANVVELPSACPACRRDRDADRG